MTSLKQHPTPLPPASAAPAQSAPWPSARPALTHADARDNETARLERTTVAAHHRRGQDGRSALIIGSIVVAGSLAWLLFTR